MNKADLKILIIITVVFLFVGFISYLVLNGMDMQKKSFNGSLIVDGKEYWKYEDDEWQNLYSIKDINWKQFKVYTNNDYINTYFVTLNNNKLYFFDDENNSYNVEYPILAVSSQSNILPVNYEFDNFNDNDNQIITEYLKSKKINYDGEYSVLEKYRLDLNNDGNDDWIYILSNELYSKNNTFYVVFARVKNKNITINEQIAQDNYTKYKLAWVLNVTSDNLCDIILKRYYIDNYDYYLYQYNKKNGYLEIFNRN